MTTLNKVEKWLQSNTYQLEQFRDLSNLAKLKQEKGYSVAVVIPTLEEEETVGNVLECLTTKLIKQNNIVDEMIIIDGGSTDKTQEICTLFSEYVQFYEQSKILTEVCNIMVKVKLYGRLYMLQRVILSFILIVISRTLMKDL